MELVIRPATREDIGILGRYQIDSYGGFADVMYADSVPGLTTRQIVEMRMDQDDATYGFANGRIAETPDGIAGGYQAYPIDDEANDPPDPFIPSDRLFNFAPFEGLTLPGSYYLNAISVEPAFRGNGIGRTLLQHAMDAGHDAGFERISLYVFEQNASAVRLYTSFGFREMKRRTVLNHPALKFDGGMLLMAATI